MKSLQQIQEENREAIISANVACNNLEGLNKRILINSVITLDHVLIAINYVRIIKEELRKANNTISKEKKAEALRTYKNLIDENLFKWPDFDPNIITLEPGQIEFIDEESQRIINNLLIITD